MPSKALRRARMNLNYSYVRVLPCDARYFSFHSDPLLLGTACLSEGKNLLIGTCFEVPVRRELMTLCLPSRVVRLLSMTFWAVVRARRVSVLGQADRVLGTILYVSV